MHAETYVTCPMCRGSAIASARPEWIAVGCEYCAECDGPGGWYEIPGTQCRIVPDFWTRQTIPDIPIE